VSGARRGILEIQLDPLIGTRRGLRTGEGLGGRKTCRSTAGSALPAHVWKGMALMATGKVKWFNDQKGFGFIMAEATGKDVFVHHSVIEGSGFKTLLENENVEYEFEESPKGMKATKVRRLVAAAAN
jgi:CspA family cold shock protein